MPEGGEHSSDNWYLCPKEVSISDQLLSGFERGQDGLCSPGGQTAWLLGRAKTARLGGSHKGNGLASTSLIEPHKVRAVEVFASCYIQATGGERSGSTKRMSNTGVALIPAEATLAEGTDRPESTSTA